MCQSTAQGSATGGLVVGIGGTTGALIIYTGQDHQGQEIEISPVDQPPDVPRTHAEVREWRVRDGVFFSAVYPDLHAGAYQVWWDRSIPAGQVIVHGGSVVEFSWPTRPGG